MKTQRGGGQQRDGPHERHLERPRTIGLLDAQHQHADADEHEGEQRADVRQIVGLGRVADQRPRRHEQPREQRRRPRDARARMDAGRPLRQQAVARHREEDARLAVLEHEQHRRHRHRRAERDDPADRREARQLERARQRIGHGKFLVRHHAGQHRADHDVDDRADGEPAEDADRQVALRVLRLLRRRRDRVEPDVGEEHDRRALVDAGEAVGRERRDSWRRAGAWRRRRRTAPAP